MFFNVENQVMSLGLFGKSLSLFVFWKNETKWYAKDFKEIGIESS
jgi:hypothetical protein